MKNLISWEFPKFENYQRRKGWYIWATIIFVLLILYSVLSANFLFGLIIILATIIIFLNHHKGNSKINFAVTPKGIQVDNKFHNFKDIQNFWIIYEPPQVKKVYFQLKNAFKTTFSIPLEKINPLEVRKTLKQHLEENLDKESESTLDTLERILKL